MTDKTAHQPELDSIKMATAMMFAALVDTIVGTDSPQAKIFAANIEKCHRRMTREGDDINGLELLSWTRLMITPST